jgi:hypothetical protein
MKTQDFVNLALTGLDFLGYQLQELQITDKVNRHNTFAFVMAEQNRLKGELDSFSARLDQKKARVEKVKRQAEAVFDAGIQVASYPFQVVRGALHGQQTH